MTGPDPNATPETGWRFVLSAIAEANWLGHDIPHPIGDPHEDEGLPGDDDENGEEDEEDEEPLQASSFPRKRAPIRARPGGVRRTTLDHRLRGDDSERPVG